LLYSNKTQLTGYRNLSWSCPGRSPDPDTTQDLVQLPTGADFPVAVAAVHRFIATRLKGHFGGFATLGAGSGEHLAGGSVAAISIALRLPCLTALRASLGLVGVAFGLEELLVLGAEGESSSTVGACEGLVWAHWMTSSLID